MIREGESEYECSTCILFFLLLEIYTRLNVLIRYCHLNVYESNKSQKSKCTVLCSNTFTVTHSEQFTFYQMCCWEWESRPESFQVHDSKGWISIQQFDVFCFVFFFMPTTLKWNSYVVNEFRMVEMYEFGGIFTRYLLIEWCHRYTRAKEVTPIIFHTIAKPCELACMCIGFASIGLSTLSYFVNDGVKSKFHSVSLSDFSFAQWSITISRIQVDRALINVRMKKHDA